MTTEQCQLLFQIETILGEIQDCLEKIKENQTAGLKKRLKRLKSQALEMSAKLMDS